MHSHQSVTNGNLLTGHHCWIFQKPNVTVVFQRFVGLYCFVIFSQFLEDISLSLQQSKQEKFSFTECELYSVVFQNEVLEKVHESFHVLLCDIEIKPLSGVTDVWNLKLIFCSEFRDLVFFLLYDVSFLCKQLQTLLLHSLNDEIE